MSIEMVALSALAPSPLNIRGPEGYDEGALKALAANIHRYGLLQNLEAHNGANGKYMVHVGGRRLAALALLVAEKKIAPDHRVPVRIIPEADAKERSLSENFERQDMEPIDEAIAFAEMAQGSTPEDVAAAFGVKVRYVLQRMKLAALSPKLIKALRTGELGLGAAEAYAMLATKDQEKAFKMFGDRSPDWLRRDMRRQAAEATEVQFTEAEYIKAGGEPLRDLFVAGIAGVSYPDAKLVAKLQLEKVTARAERLKAAGWTHVIVTKEDRELYNAQSQGNRLYGQNKHDERRKIEAERLAVSQKEPRTPEDHEAIATLTRMLEDLESDSFTPAQRANSGVMIHIGAGGKVTTMFGHRTKEQISAARKTEKASKKADTKGKADKAKAEGGYSKPAVQYLAARMTRIIQTAALDDADFCDRVLLFKLLSRDGSLRAHRHWSMFKPWSDLVPESAAQQKFHAAIAKDMKRKSLSFFGGDPHREDILPKLWPLIQAMPVAAVRAATRAMTLAASGVENYADNYDEPFAEYLAAFVAKPTWRPDARFLDMLSKKQILDALRECGLKPETIARTGSQAKEGIVATAVTMFSNPARAGIFEVPTQQKLLNWLPKPMRQHGAKPKKKGK